MRERQTNQSVSVRALLGRLAFCSSRIRPQHYVLADQNSDWRASADAQSWPNIEFAIDNAPTNARGFLCGGVADAFGYAIAVIALRFIRGDGRRSG